MTFEVVASGDVADYTDEVKDGIAASVAASLVGVDSSAVTVTVTSASVLISVSIAVADAAGQTALTSQVSTKLASTDSATTMLTSQLPSGALTISVTDIRVTPGFVGGLSQVSDGNALLTEQAYQQFLDWPLWGQILLCVGVGVVLVGLLVGCICWRRKRRSHGHAGQAIGTAGVILTHGRCGLRRDVQRGGPSHPYAGGLDDPQSHTGVEGK